MAIPDIPNMALLKPEVLDSALEFHGSLSFPNVFPVNRASVQSYSICRDVPKCKFGFNAFLPWEGKIEAVWKCKGSSDEVKAHRRQ